NRRLDRESLAEPHVGYIYWHIFPRGGIMPVTTGGAVWRSAAIGCIALTLAACLTEQKREEKSAVGELTVNVNKKSDGEGYTPAWAPSTDENTPLAIDLE